MSAWPSVGFSKHGASERVRSFAPFLLPFTTPPPQMPPVNLIASNVIGTSSDSQSPAADSSTNPTRPLPLARQASLGHIPITLVAGPPPTDRPTTKPPVPPKPKRSATVPANPSSAPQPGNPPPRPLQKIPRPTVPPPEPPVNRPVLKPGRPTVPPPDPPVTRPVPKPRKPPVPPPPVPGRQPEPLKLAVPYEQPLSVRRAGDALSPIPIMSPAEQRTRSVYSDDESDIEVPAPKTPRMKFEPAEASSPKAKATFRPDATAVSNLEKIKRPVFPDNFFSSNRVMSLDVTNFARYIKSKEITLVIFYDRNDPGSKVHEKTISQAACSTKRANHAYAAVDCSASAKLCAGNKVTDLPQVRLYSGATCLGQMEDLRNITSDTLRQYVEMAPTMQGSRMMACPYLKEED